MRQHGKIAVERDERRTKETGEVITAVKFTSRSGSSTNVVHADLGDLGELEDQIRRFLRPTAYELHEATLDGTCETGGDTACPTTGWFALVPWDNGHEYLIACDTTGFYYHLGHAPAGDEGLHRRYQQLIANYDRWTDVAENEM
jgi:hypothetical protein